MQVPKMRKSKKNEIHCMFSKLYFQNVHPKNLKHSYKVETVYILRENKVNRNFYWEKMLHLLEKKYSKVIFMNKCKL